MDDCETTRLVELNEAKYENRVVAIFDNQSYGYAYGNLEFNHTFLSDCSFPTVYEFYNSGEYDLNEADCYNITKKEFETERKNAIRYCQEHSIIPNRLP